MMLRLAIDIAPPLSVATAGGAAPRTPRGISDEKKTE